MAIKIVPRGNVPPNEVNEFFKFSCPPVYNGPNTDPKKATFSFRRKLQANIDLELPDGSRVPMWVIEDPDAPDAPHPLPKDIFRRSFPSPTLRIPLDAVVDADVDCSGNTHTIHWHGIEPTPMNDGVGHVSFEVTGHFNYQFQPRQAGTFFYHCHKNTVLHFEMGLYGLLVIDPPRPEAPEVPVTYRTGGPGYAAAFNPAARVPSDHVIRYDVEAVWIPDEIDTRWHTLNHNAFMQKCDRDDPVERDNFVRDGFLNDIRPDIFVLTGLARRARDATPFSAAENPLFGPLVAPKIGAGQTLLVRTVAASYATSRFTLGIDAEVIAMDGHALGVPPFQQYSHPFTFPAGTPITLTSARRFDLIVRPQSPGVVPVTVEFLDNISGRLLYTGRTGITVTP